jgi:hypothetical protein
VTGQGAPDPREAVCWRSECRAGCYYPNACSLAAQDTAGPADGLSEDEVDLLRQALKRWLPVSYEGGVKYLAAAVEAIIARQRPTAPPEDRVTAAVEALHRTDAAASPFCDHCGFSWPCPTIRAIEVAAREDNGGAGDA